MSALFAVQCGKAAPPIRSSGWQAITLDLSARRGNVRLSSRDITRKLVNSLDPVWADLVEIATYVYVADQAARRDNTLESLGIDWRRQFSFSIPVRRPDVWSGSPVAQSLVELLNFLSGDIYSFRFEKLTGAPPVQLGLLTDRELGGRDIDEVVLFSGGLDSLGGALQMGATTDKNVLLVSHRSSPKISDKQKKLAVALGQRFGTHRFCHVPVWINKDKTLSEEFTQRTRTFLFASLAGAMATMLELRRIHFFENGITSVNLPITGQIVSTRASRSTHPRVLAAISSLFSALAGKNFQVKNDFFWKTKTEVVNLIGDLGGADLIARTVSCHHTWEMTNLHTHCGKCSQCVGRRIATLASRYGPQDPEVMYGVDLLTGERKPGRDLTLMESTVLYAKTLRDLSEHEFYKRSGEALAALSFLRGPRAKNLRRIFKLHQRHAEEVNRVLNRGFAEHAEEIRERRLPSTCMLTVSLAPPSEGSKRTQQFPALPWLSATEDFRTVWAGDTEFTFTATQAACLKYMVEQSCNGPASISQAAILVGAESRCRSLKSLFKRSPAWKHLLVTGERKGTYRLNPMT